MRELLFFGIGFVSCIVVLAVTLWGIGKKEMKRIQKWE